MWPIEHRSLFRWASAGPPSPGWWISKGQQAVNTPARFLWCVYMCACVCVCMCMYMHMYMCVYVFSSVPQAGTSVAEDKAYECVVCEFCGWWYKEGNKDKWEREETYSFVPHQDKTYIPYGFATWNASLSSPPREEVQQIPIDRINDGKMCQPSIFRKHWRFVRGRRMWACICGIKAGQVVQK